MNNSSGVRGLERGGDLHHDGNGFAGGELPFFVDQTLEVASLDILHGDELDALGLTEIENADDVTMGHFAREDEFLFEAAQDFGMAGEFGTDQFERHQAFEFRVARLVDGTHPTLTQELQNFEALGQESSRL